MGSSKAYTKGSLSRDTWGGVKHTLKEVPVGRLVTLKNLKNNNDKKKKKQ